MICRRLSLFAIVVLLAACSLLAQTTAQTMPAASTNPMFDKAEIPGGQLAGKRSARQRRASHVSNWFPTAAS